MPVIRRKLDTLLDVGLGYITLGQSAITLSGGEAQRIKLATELARMDTGKTIYFLDEPETALSPRSQLKLLEIIETNSEAGHAQFFIATHSPILLSVAGATIYSFDSVPVRPIAYEETDHYQVYREFFKRGSSL